MYFSRHFFPKAWFPYRCICRVFRTKKIHRTDGIHSISYNKLYLPFLLYWAFVQEVSIKLYLSYEFFSYNRHNRYNDMETRLNDEGGNCQIISNALDLSNPQNIFNLLITGWLSNIPTGLKLRWWYRRRGHFAKLSGREWKSNASLSFLSFSFALTSSLSFKSTSCDT